MLGSTYNDHRVLTHVKQQFHKQTQLEKTTRPYGLRAVAKSHHDIIVQTDPNNNIGRIVNN